MAVGDVVNGVAQVLASGTVDYQPAAGVEVMILEAGCLDSDVYVGLTDGTNRADLARGSLGLSSDGTNWHGAGGRRIAVTNSVYLRMYNAGAANPYAGYAGYQTK